MKQELIELFRSNFKEGEDYNHHEIRELLENNKNAVIKNVAAYTYNRWNKGMSDPQPFFEWIGRGYYKFLGQNFLYNGFIFHHPQGGSVKKIGLWENGNYSFLNPSIKTFKDWKDYDKQDSFEKSVCYLENKIKYVSLDGSITQKVILKDGECNNEFTDNYKHINYKSGLGQILFLESIDNSFEFGNNTYKIVEIF